ncbi:isoprenylcysteine carboxyl methyltransferase family protein [Thalassobacillus sp. CUG 92003]|uniref:isoprenylcysteine carboxyl methyltransferase family protein n=1 Tax=Thalassobacillus sp. CUG 92003 TaxID=2736641 RepID=UPI0015E63AC7|nr:isoprenylcysteine carboxylmethyltransferase family protein [Thalassobacillus sp. CUG 92003]
MIAFLFLYGFIIGQRGLELALAERNRRYMMENGGVEFGRSHYKWFIMTHVAFFISLGIEAFVINEPVSFSIILFSLFIVLQAARIWCIASLGKYWNTRVIVLPTASLVNRGPYHYFKHPNYIIVGLELLIIPLLFEAWVTAIIFPIVHILLLTVRLPIENKALGRP